MELSTHYPISLPTKAYLKPYIETLYGNPVVINLNNVFGIVIASLLERPVKAHVSREQIQYRVFDKFDTKLTIYIPRVWLKEYKYGYALSEQQIIGLNKFYEERFEEDICKHCSLAIIYQVEIKKALEDFCRRHKIEIEEHITYDALKKKEYRYRKSKENPPNLSPNFFSKTSEIFSKKKAEIKPAILSRQKIGFGILARA